MLNVRLFNSANQIRYTIGISVIIALTSSHRQILAQAVQFIPPPPPIERGETSGRRQGGASRGNCPSTEQPVTALVPAIWNSKQKSGGEARLEKWESVWGKTVSNAPTFWFYVPYSTPNLPLIFVLQDNKGRKIYETTTTTSQDGGSGIIKVSLPTDGSVSLETEKLYRWYFVVDCNQDAPPQVDGWVQKVSLSPYLKQQIESASPLQRVALYAANGIWYDALNTLAQLRASKPRNPDLSAEWISLLKSIGLDAIASKPIRSCCQQQQITRTSALSSQPVAD